MGDERTRVSLREVLTHSDGLRTVDALALVRGVLTVLADAHSRGVVHGDVAPTSILIDESGTPTLVGFGSAVCTSGYGAPEVVAGGTADERSDVFSACVVLAELLRGETFFGAAVTEERPAPDMSTVDTAVAEVLARGLDVGPRHRPADASALLALLDDAAERTLGGEWLAAASLGGLGSVAAAIGAGALTAGSAGGVGASAGAAALGAQAGASVGAAAVGSKAGSTLGAAGAAALGTKAGAAATTSAATTALGTKAGAATISSGGSVAVGTKVGAVSGKAWAATGAGAAVVAAGVAVVVLWPDTVEQTASPVTTTTTTTQVVAAAPPPPAPPPPPAGPTLSGTYETTVTFRTATVSSVITIASDCPQCDARFTVDGVGGTMTWNGTGWERTDGGACLMRHVVTPTSVVDGIVQTFSQVSTMLTPASCGVSGDMTGTGVRTGG